jgi:hypothetical protein
LPSLSVTLRRVAGPQAVVVGAEQDQVVQFGVPAVFPVPDVVGVQAAGGCAAGYHAGGVAVFQGAAQPAGDGAGGPAGSDGLSVTFEPHLAGGVTGQALPLGVLSVL